MVREGDYVAIFNSIHRVMKAEKILKTEKLPILLIPAPRSLSSDCGLAIRYAGDQREQVEALLDSAALIPEEIHLFRNGAFTRLDCRERIA